MQTTSASAATDFQQPAACRPAATGQAPPAPSPASTETLNADAEEHVDVQKAEREFESLRHELSRHSSRQQSKEARDLEKQDAGSEGDFDLLHYLQGELDAADEAGRKSKALGVAWKGLRVVGAGGDRQYISTFAHAVRDWCLWAPMKAMKLAGYGKEVPRDLLCEFDGCLKPGEMCLVLGRPGSGCTTFLKTIANNRGGYLAVEGDVSYGGIPAAEMAKRYRGEIVYNQEDDVHAATLSVAQTLRFALSLKSPGQLLPGKTKKALEEEVLDVLTRMLGIAHTKNTMVGNAHVRGVSGGERKRVSIAEMMATRATVCSWDNSTRGLDASTALDYAKALRVLTDVHQMATFVSLYQAGEGIYEQFDKVLVIDEGRQVYFGPAKEARAYMMSLGYADLPRQTSADYLTGCTDSNERKLNPSFPPSSVPQTSSALEAAFKQSDIHRRMVDERDQYLVASEEDEKHARDFREAVMTDKRRGARRKSPYTAPFAVQVWELAKRQVLLKLQDPWGLAFTYASSIIIALVIGTTFLQLETTSKGAFQRSGSIFLGLIFCGFEAFNELPSQMQGRPIVWKHSSFALYRPGATTLASILADLPNNLFRMLLFSVVFYFLVGLYASAGAFFSFYILVVTTFLASSSIFRLFGTITKNYDEANRYVSLIMTLFELLSGYLIPIYAQKRWIAWISYINPYFYGFSGAMANEFKRITLTCDGDYITPNSLGGVLTQYPDALGPNQVCTVAGATGGSDVIPGADYIAAAYEYYVKDQWRNFAILIAITIGLSVIQSIFAEFAPDGNTVPRVNVFAKENAERKKLNEELEKNKQAYRKGEMEQDLSGLIQTKKPFTWENLTYTVPVPGGQRQLLDNVNGYVRPGQLTALMGSSGAGKTTLLDVLANRKTIGVIGGERLVAGRVPGREFQRGTAYVEQQDVHEPTSTVREALRFSAYLRQSASVSKEEKDRYVEEVIQLLELEDAADAMIGVPGMGLDVEARKRVTIGVELASKPQLLLFLDEPTSGLDGQSAYNIVRFLRKLAAAGQAILVTIHQPNAMLFENFDRLLLLKAGGRTVYFGDIGKDSHVLREYLARNGATCPDDANPAEYMLEAIGAGSGRAVGKKDWADIWSDSPEFETVKREIAQLNKEGLDMKDDTDASLAQEYAVPFWTQLQHVSKRALVSFYRSPDYGFTRLFNHIIMGLCVALVYLQLGYNQQAAQYKTFAIFYLVIIPAIIMAQVCPMYLQQRDIFIREASARMYSSSVFALGQLIAEMPYNLLCAVGYFLIFYYPIGFNYSSDRAGYAFAFILLLEIFSVVTGQMVAALSPSEYIAEMSLPFLLVVFSLFCGVTVRPSELNVFYGNWLLQFNPFTWLQTGMTVNEMHGLPIECNSRELRVFDPPSGQSCAEWAGAFLEAGTGYLTNPDATSGCEYCQFSNGDEYLEQYGWTFDHRARAIGVFLCYCVSSCVITVLASRYLTFRYSKR
ncbi:hypothetical protein JCM8547_002670 [Rhodosporidiobolus lusitaniae]